MIKFQALLLTGLLSLTCSVSAQVYKSTDADGNVTFSDTPSADSEEVKVEETNVADPTKVPENTTPAPAPEVVKKKPPPDTTVQSNDDYDDGDDGGNLRERRRAQRKIRRHQREERHR